MRRNGRTLLVFGLLFIVLTVLIFRHEESQRIIKKDIRSLDQWPPREITITDNKKLAMANLEKAPAYANVMLQPRSRYKFVLEPAIADKIKRQIASREGRWTSVTIVKSAYGNRDRRAAIRDTWGSCDRFDGAQFITVFLIGQPPKSPAQGFDKIRAEHKAHGDILMVDMPDDGEHVPEKTLAGMQWATDSLPLDWIYSTADDDMSLHVPNFVRYIDTVVRRKLRATEHRKYVVRSIPIMCVYSYQVADPPARKPTSKWHMPKKRYPLRYWPPYCRGGWYAMPVELAGNLYAISRWMEYLHLDDVWITGLMRIKYAAASRDRDTLIRTLLDAAPLSLRNDTELVKNVNETPANVIVSHAWGNIAGRKVDVVQKLRQNWKEWSPLFEVNDQG